MNMPKNKALFLDRDGVICKSINGYLTKWEEFELIPGIVELVTSAKEKGYMVAVATNQPQVSKGLLAEADLLDIHNKMQALLGNQIDRIYYCPHRNEDNCDCRKPKPGMLVRAAQDLDIDLTQSIMVGDREKDVAVGKAMRCKTVFIKNEFNAAHLANCSPDHVVQSLAEIISLI